MPFSFVDQINRYLEKTGTSPRQFGVGAVNNSSFHGLPTGKYQRGKHPYSPRLDTVEKVKAFMKRYPTGYKAPWRKPVPRQDPPKA